MWNFLEKIFFEEVKPPKKVFCNDCYYYNSEEKICSHVSNRIYEYTHIRKFKGFKELPSLKNKNNDCKYFDEGDIPF